MLRPLRLIRLNTAPVNHGERVEMRESRANKEIDVVPERTEPIQEDMPPNMLGAVETAEIEEVGEPLGEVGAQHLLKRSPNGYLLNQIYGLWFYISWFILMTIITHKVSTEQYGVLAVLLTASNTILYIVAFGLEDAITTYVPRIFAEQGLAAAGSLIRRLLLLRIAVLILSTCALLFSLPLLSNLIATLPINGAKEVAAGLRDPLLLTHNVPIAIYVVGSSIGGLLSAVCAAFMRMRIVLVVSGLTQLALLVIGFLVLQLGWGVDGVLWALAISTLANAIAFTLWLAPTLIVRRAQYKQPLGPVVKLGISAWQTNLVNGALLKQTLIILLGYFAISLTQRGFFNLSFQLADAANTLLVMGFIGVGSSALAAAAIGKNYDRLSRSWEALIKVETLLTAPVLVFCLFNAQNIVAILYTKDFAAVGPLLAIFLFFNTIVRVLGTTIHQSTLYVMNKSRLVVLSQWAGMLAVVVLGIALIPHYGPAGALVADGIAKSLTGALLLAFLWHDLPRKYPLGFTLRFLLALTIAALPGIVWHPTNRILFGLSGVIFLVLCAGLLLVMKPLNAADMEMIQGVSPRVVRYLRWFARG